MGHAEYRRCIDPADERDRASTLSRFPEPTDPGFYWAEWRVAEDGTWPPREDGTPRDHVVSFRPEVVEVRVDFGSSEKPNAPGYDWPLVASVAGFEKEQPLENFVWRSGKLEAP